MLALAQNHVKLEETTEYVSRVRQLSLSERKMKEEFWLRPAGNPEEAYAPRTGASSSPAC